MPSYRHRLVNRLLVLTTLFVALGYDLNAAIWPALSLLVMNLLPLLRASLWLIEQLARQAGRALV
jgi:hypothetical protein